MTQPLTFFPVYDMAASARSERLKFWLPLSDLFPDLISSRHVVHKNALVSAYYASMIVNHGLRDHLKMDPSVKLFMDSGGYQQMTGRFKADARDLIEILRYQERNRADIAATLDFPFRPEKTSVWEGWRRIEITIKYAVMSIENRQDKNMKLYAVINGWDYLSAKKIAERISRYEFDGFAIGAPEPGHYQMNSTDYLLKLAQIIYALKETIRDRPIHVFGISNFPSIYVLAMLGVSSFDSLKYLHLAKFRGYLLANGSSAYVGRRSKSHMKLVELPCCCPICSEVQSDFLSANGSLQGALLAVHNLMVIRNQVRLISSALIENWLPRLLSRGMKDFPSIVPGLRWLSSKDGSVLASTLIS